MSSVSSSDSVRTKHAILERLLAGPVPGPDLAAELGVTRAAVWKHVEELREEGVDIEGGSGGYAVRGLPEYGWAALTAAVPDPYTVIYEPALASTNDVAKELAASGELDVLVAADEQPGGRGRLGREWVGPPGGVYASLLFRPDRGPADAPFLTIAAGAAVADGLVECGLEPGIKWPNDVLVGGNKVAGILTEMEAEADRIRWVVLGLGINANVPDESLPDRATSLASVCGAAVERAPLLGDILSRFETYRRNPDRTLTAWRENAITLGQAVRADTPHGPITGTAVDIDPSGALEVETADGIERVHAGDCEHLRPRSE